MLFKLSKFFLIILIFAVILNFQNTVPLVFGKEIVEIEIKNELINPGSFYYPFKRAWEKSRERLIFFSKDKAEYDESLLKVRLSELQYVVRNKVLSELQRSSERFSYQAGILIEHVSAQSEKANKEQVLEKFNQYTTLLARLRDQFPANSSFWLLIQQNIDTLKFLSDQLK